MLNLIMKWALHELVYWDYLIYRKRVRWMRGMLAREARLIRLQGQYCGLARHRDLQSEVNHGKNYVLLTCRMVLVAQRYNKLKFWFMPLQLVEVKSCTINQYIKRSYATSN